ncbi:MAG: hypothetical protein R3Y62_04960 [Eubacteriales bacterium]
MVVDWLMALSDWFPEVKFTYDWDADDAMDEDSVVNPPIIIA